MADMDEIRVVRGEPSDEELAALVGVLLLRSAPTTTSPSKHSAWTASGRPGVAYRDGRPPRPGHGAWRASAQPR